MLAPAKRAPGFDLAVDPRNPHAAVAIESLLSKGVYSVFLRRNADDGATWTQSPSFPLAFSPGPSRSQRSNPDRVYVSARLNVAESPRCFAIRRRGSDLVAVTHRLARPARNVIGAVDRQSQSCTSARAFL